MDANKLSSISRQIPMKAWASSGDTHDFTEFDNPDLPDVKFVITYAVPIEVELFTAVVRQAHQRGVQVETLANLWLQQKLVEQRQYAAA